jgi:arylsulfatase A-like enzyme
VLGAQTVDLLLYRPPNCFLKAPFEASPRQISGICNFVDRNVGRVLMWLEHNGLADNTIVFFLSDHGEAFLRGKYFLYDCSLNQPLIIRWPKACKPPRKLLLDPLPEEELYDLQTDLHELKNIAHEAAQADRKQRLRLKLDTWIEQSGDLGFEPLDPEHVKYFDKYRARGRKQNVDKHNALREGVRKAVESARR